MPFKSVLLALEGSTWACFTAYFMPFKLAFYLQVFWEGPHSCRTVPRSWLLDTVWHFQHFALWHFFRSGLHGLRWVWVVGCGLRIAGSGTKAEIGIFGQVTLLACTERVFGAASNGCPDTLVAGSKDLNWADPPAKRTRGLQVCHVGQRSSCLILAALTSKMAQQQPDNNNTNNKCTTLVQRIRYMTQAPCCMLMSCKAIASNCLGFHHGPNWAVRCATWIGSESWWLWGDPSRGLIAGVFDLH